MPIYAYRCARCGFEKDVLQKMSDPLLVTCPSCGEPALEKQVTAAGFQLKGSGWYVTDFRNPAAKEAKKTDKSEESAASAPQEGAAPVASDATPAASPAQSGGDSAQAAPAAPAPTPVPTKSAPPKASSGSGR